MGTPLRRSLGLVLAFGCAVAFGSSAQADTIKLFSGHAANYGTQAYYNSAAANQGLFLDTACPGGTSAGCLSADVVSTSQSYTAADGITLTFTATNNGNTASSWADWEPAYGGMGVGPGTGEDQIDGLDILTIKFSQAVTLKGVLTLVSSHHTPFGPNNPSLANSTALYLGGAQFLLNGVLTSFNDANGDALDITSDTFTFAVNANDNPFFYVSGLVWDVCNPCGAPGDTPLPAALPLFASGLGALGVLGWRRKRKTQAA